MTTLLDRLIPAPRSLELQHVDVAAAPERVWELVRHGDLARSPLIRAFFELRALPERLAGKHAPHSLRIDQLRSTPEQPGFSLLLEEPPREFVVGAIGKVWRPVIPFVYVPDAQSFLDLAEPDQVKVAWALRVLKLGAGTRVELEVRVGATNDAAWRKFQRYFRVIGPGSHFIRRVLLQGLVAELGSPQRREPRRSLPGDDLLPDARAEVTDGMQHEMLEQLAARVEGRLPRDDYRDVLEGLGGAARMLVAFLTPYRRSARSHWGVAPDEAAAARPGDELVPEPLWSWTHGIRVDAPPARVWRWIAQLGADRAGFYSYQWLENLAGCGVRNADTVHPDWDLELGGCLLLHPKAPPLRIARLERDRYFVAHAPIDETARAARKPWATATWLLQIEALADCKCRVISRYRVACSAELATRLSLGPTLMEPIGFAMDRRMLLGIKQRAERELRHPLGIPAHAVSSP